MKVMLNKTQNCVLRCLDMFDVFSRSGYPKTRCGPERVRRIRWEKIIGGSEASTSHALAKMPQKFCPTKQKKLACFHSGRSQATACCNWISQPLQRASKNFHITTHKWHLHRFTTPKGLKISSNSSCDQIPLVLLRFRKWSEKHHGKSFNRKEDGAAMVSKPKCWTAPWQNCRPLCSQEATPWRTNCLGFSDPTTAWKPHSLQHPLDPSLPVVWEV